VLALALLARLWQIDLTRFFNDQVAFLGSATAWIDSGRFPLSSGLTFAVGTTGAPIHHPPLVTWLLAGPALISRDPVWVSGCVAALDALAAPLVYLTARRLAGPGVALAGGCLYALNPTAIVYGRMIWNPDFVPFFAALALFGLVDFWARGRSWSLALSLLAAGCAAELHVVNAIFLPFWLIVAVLGWRKVRPLPLASGAGALLLTIAPYVYLQTQTRWQDAVNLLGYLGRPKAADFEALDQAAAQAGPATFSRLWPAADQVVAPFQYDGLTWLLIGLALLGLAAAAWRFPRGPRVLVAGWLLLPILGSLRHTGTVVPHYLFAMLPAVAVLQALGLAECGSALSRLARRGRLPGGPHRPDGQQPAASTPPFSRAADPHALETSAGQWRTALAPAAVGALLAALAVSYAGFLHRASTDTRQVEFGAPLRYSLAAAQAVRTHAAGLPLYLAVPALYDHTVPALAGREDQDWHWGKLVLVFPRTRAWYLAENDGVSHALLSRSFGPAAAEALNSVGQPDFSLFDVPANGQERVFTGPSFVPLRADLDGAIRLEGALPLNLAAGRASEVLLLWRILDASRVPGDLNEFAHLVDPAGAPVSAGRDLFDIREPWRDGDVVASSIDLDVTAGTPTGGYWLETGFYETFGQRQLGSPVRIGPLKVRGGGSQPAATSGAPLATLGEGQIALLTADWRGQDVALDWQALAKPAASYTVFVHVVDASGKLLAQWDGLPRGGSYPTTLWDAGETVRDVYHLDVAAAPGLRLEMGMYTQPDIRRLPVRQAGGDVSDEITVSPSL
jgi:4-amino-4-deoxy-L-arabinose transferase-like glycosyltransferase